MVIHPTSKIQVMWGKLTEKCLTVKPGDPRHLHRDVIDQHLLLADRYVQINLKGEITLRFSFNAFCNFSKLDLLSLYLQVVGILQLCISQCPCCHVNQDVFLWISIIQNRRKENHQNLDPQCLPVRLLLINGGDQWANAMLTSTSSKNVADIYRFGSHRIQLPRWRLGARYRGEQKKHYANFDPCRFHFVD